MSDGVLARVGKGSQQTGVGQGVSSSAGQKIVPVLQGAGRREVSTLGQTEGIYRQSGESSDFLTFQKLGDLFLTCPQRKQIVNNLQ